LLSRSHPDSPTIGEAGAEVSEPKRTSRGRVKRVATLPASFGSGAIPPTCTRDACDTGWDEATEEGPRGEGDREGGEKLKDKRLKETKHKEGGFQGKGKGDTVEKRKRPLSEAAGTAGEP